MEKRIDSLFLFHNCYNQNSKVSGDTGQMLKTSKNVYPELGN